ncbi:hypothetical protein [Curtobacterium sp. MCBD17_040]|uniref:hypothetical protein n=1 Tax=Curtobacterium sp. MCBD17_040 TaxID=2175674 RepID=UPI000DA8938B|nr:hypothetical protein [Curtobacterium sp. MCBD17_040]WIB65567.1 hypothetical protein DEI94_19525 [Curtobacterium sp. MCBD17_040]
MLAPVIVAAAIAALITTLVVQDRRRAARYAALSRTGQMAVVNAELEAEHARIQVTAEAYAGPHALDPTPGIRNAL